MSDFKKFYYPFGSQLAQRILGSVERFEKQIRMKVPGQNKDYTGAKTPWGLDALHHWQEQIRYHYTKIADRRDAYIRDNQYYFDYVTQMLRFIIEPGKRVLQLEMSAQLWRGEGNDARRSAILLPRVRAFDGAIGVDIVITEQPFSSS